MYVNCSNCSSKCGINDVFKLFRKWETNRKHHHKQRVPSKPWKIFFSQNCKNYLCPFLCIHVTSKEAKLELVRTGYYFKNSSLLFRNFSILTSASSWFISNALFKSSCAAVIQNTGMFQNHLIHDIVTFWNLLAFV